MAVEKSTELPGGKLLIIPVSTPKEHTEAI